MADVIIGIALAVFVIIGLKEGFAKSFGSLVLIFVALFLAANTMSMLAQSNPQFNDPNYIGTSVAFLAVWCVIYGILDFLLYLLLKKIISITVLGPVDKIGGIIVGGFKGLIICGIIIQLLLALPLSKDTRKQIAEGQLSGFCVAAYQWTYPYVKKITPKISNLTKINIIEEMNKAEKKETPAEGTTPDKFIGTVKEYGKAVSSQEAKIKQLLKEQKILPSIPQGKQ